MAKLSGGGFRACGHWCLYVEEWMGFVKEKTKGGRWNRVEVLEEMEKGMKLRAVIPIVSLV